MQFRHAMAALGAALLSACGSGGSSNVEVPVAATLERAFGGPLQLELKGPDGLVLRIVRGPGETTTPGARAIREWFGILEMETTRETISLRQNGFLLSSVSRDLHWTSNPLRLYGTSNDSNQCSWVTSWYPPPETAGAGQGGTLYMATAEGPCNSVYLPTTMVNGTWYTQDGPGATTYVCVHVPAEDQCYRITENGHLMGGRAQAVIGDRTWLFE